MKTKLIGLVMLMCMIASVSLMACSPTDTQVPDNGANNNDTPKEYSNEVQVVLLLGQSNGEGHTYSSFLSKTVGDEKTLEYTEGYDNVKISYACTISENTSNGQFESVKLGQGHSALQFGPEVGMAEKISAVDPSKRVYIIKYAYGGTSLTTQWRSPSSKNTGSLYRGAVDYALEQCRALEEMDLYPVIKAICWMQGEDDASGLSYNSYQQLEENFVKDLRNDLAYYKPTDSEIGFVDAGISDCVAWTHYQTVNLAKQTLAQNGTAHVYIDTIAQNLRYNGEPKGAVDIYHYDSSSMIELGHLFANALLADFLEI